MNFFTQSAVRPVSAIKSGISGIVPGQEPWKDVKSRQFKLPNGRFVGVMHSPKNNCTIALSCIEGEWVFTSFWDVDPSEVFNMVKGDNTIDDVLKSSENASWSGGPECFDRHVDAASFFLKFCRGQN